MRFDVLTLFPQIFAGYLRQSLLNKALEAGLVDVHLHDIRQWTTDHHHSVDDRPFGGGPGMVLQVEPVVECVEAVQAQTESGRVIVLTPQGRTTEPARCGTIGGTATIAAVVRTIRRIRSTGDRHPATR